MTKLLVAFLVVSVQLTVGSQWRRSVSWRLDSCMQMDMDCLREGRQVKDTVQTGLMTMSLGDLKRRARRADHRCMIVSFEFNILKSFTLCMSIRREESAPLVLWPARFQAVVAAAASSFFFFVGSPFTTTMDTATASFTCYDRVEAWNSLRRVWL
ncbi:hypothetical protein NC651_036044 [Populus alba x Populus x berolinensis]|nr:hypothetical protein NC651_036044 [Populus alba x Populus x berolinensis]